MKIALVSLAFVSLAFAGLVGGASAQTQPSPENGRYVLSPIPDGVLRLDTRTGAVSTCTDKGTCWTCTIIADERDAYDAEIGRLLKDNATLRADLAQRESSAGQADAVPPKPRAEGERKLEIPLPSDRDVDRMMSTVESAWRKLIDIATRMQRDVSGRI